MRTGQQHPLAASMNVDESVLANSDIYLQVGGDLVVLSTTVEDELLDASIVVVWDWKTGEQLFVRFFILLAE